MPSASRLAAEAGVTPGPGWLAACRSHLASLDKENGAAEGGEDADAVLRQVLHSDLRDVVRRCRSEDGGGDGDGGAGSNHPGRILRQAILASLGPGSSNSHTVTPPPPGNGNGSGHPSTTLPPGFRLLLQAEECTDVARGAEGRLSQQQGGKRLLKILGSDGYYGHGLATPPISNGEQQQQQMQVQHSIVLMETSPLPSLSASSPAGIKLLLHSSSGGQHPHPITVRRGIVQINPSNCTVLGGHVPHLLETQRSARERAQRRAGVGVDATVRALVGVEDGDGAEGGGEGGEADDEGEGASGDVVAPPPPQQQVPNQYQQQRQPQPQQQQQARPNQQQQQQQQQQQPRREAQMEWTPSPNPLPPTGGDNSYHRQSNGGAVARPTPSVTSLSNPYAASDGGGSGGVGAAAAAASNPYATSGRAASNPYHPSGNVTSSASASAAGTSTSSTAHGTISSWVTSSKTPAAASKVPARGGSGGGVVDLCSPEGSAAAAPGGGSSGGRPSSSTSSAALPSAHAAASGGGGGGASNNNMDVDNVTDGPFAPFHGSQDSASTAPALAGGGAGKATPASASTGTSGMASSSGASTPGGAALGLPASSGAYMEPMSFSELR